MADKIGADAADALADSQSHLDCKPPTDTLRPMPRLAPILLLLLGVSFVLAPFSTLHAHLSGAHDHHDRVLVHGGHVHDAHDRGHDGGDVHGTDQTVDMNFAIADRSVVGVNWIHWLPVICGLAIIGLTVQYSTLILRPPKKDFLPRLRSIYWRPPLRGPPVLSI